MNDAELDALYSRIQDPDYHSVLLSPEEEIFVQSENFSDSFLMGESGGLVTFVNSGLTYGLVWEVNVIKGQLRKIDPKDPDVLSLTEALYRIGRYFIRDCWCRKISYKKSQERFEEALKDNGFRFSPIIEPVMAELRGYRVPDDFGEQDEDRDGSEVIPSTGKIDEETPLVHIPELETLCMPWKQDGHPRDPLLIQADQWPGKYFLRRGVNLGDAWGAVPTLPRETVKSRIVKRNGQPYGDSSLYHADPGRGSVMRSK